MSQGIGSRFRMNGQHAEIYWSYHRAATLGQFWIDYGFLRAEILTCNPIQLTQRPLWFTVDNSASGRPPFQRQLLDATVAGQVLTGRLGPRKQ
jgi:hypothetical protein